MIIKREQASTPIMQHKKRHHCVSFCEDITVVEFECDKCTLSVSKPPLCVSRNLRNSIFLPQEVSKFFDKYYLPHDIEKRNLMTLVKQKRDFKKYQKKIGVQPSYYKEAQPSAFNKFVYPLNNKFAVTSAYNKDYKNDTNIMLDLLKNNNNNTTKDDFLSMTDNEKLWLASIQIYQLSEICTNDYYFKNFMSKHYPEITVPDMKDYVKQIQVENIRKHHFRYHFQGDAPMNNCLGKIPIFTVAHAREALEENVVSSNFRTETSVESNILLTLEYFYNLLIQIKEENEIETKTNLLNSFKSKFLKSQYVPSYMNIEKGQKLYIRFYELSKDHHFIFWKTIFESLNQFYKLNKSTRPLNALLSLFKQWLLSNSDLSHVVIISKCIEDILSFLIADKFGMSVISLLVNSVSHVKIILNSNEDERKKWGMFLGRLIKCIDNHPHVENPLIGSRKQLVQFLIAIAPNHITLKY